MVGPGDEIAASGKGLSHLRASQAGREQVIDALKDAFVQGRLTKDELDLRVSKALASYAELDALTADIPAGPPGRPEPTGQLEPTAARSPEPPREAHNRESHNRKVIQRGTAAGAGVTMAFTAAMVTLAGAGAVAGLILVPLAGFCMAVLLAGLLTLVSWVLERGSGRQAAPGPPPGAEHRAAGHRAAGRRASAGPAGPYRPIRRGRRHTAEAARHRWRPLARRYAIGYPGR
jgi:hypothetical protein